MPDPEYLVTVLQEINEEEEEKAPSLCDLPLTGAVAEESNDRRLSLSEPAELFEFLKPNLNSSSSTFSWNDLVWPSLSSTADEDIIISEKLRSLTSSSPSPLPPPSVSRSIKTRRSESFNKSNTKSPCIRPSRSHGNGRIGSPADRAINSWSGGGGAQRRSPPRCWPVLGPFHPPAAENELRSGVKNRQCRSPATLFPTVEKASSCDWSAWRLISVLSCKSHGSVAVTTPFHPYCET